MTLASHRMTPLRGMMNSFVIDGAAEVIRHSSLPEGTP
jgi:hypothetical protein